jgi:hypothetical protein
MEINGVGNMTQKIPRGHLALKKYFGDFENEETKKQLDIYFKKVMEKGVVNYFTASIVEHEKDYVVISAHKFVAKLFTDIEKEYPEEDFNYVKMGIMGRIENKLEELTTSGVKDCIDYVEFINDFAIKMYHSIMHHKKLNSNLYRMFTSVISKEEEHLLPGSTESQILFMLLQNIHPDKSIIYKTAKKYDEMDLIWQAYCDESERMHLVWKKDEFEEQIDMYKKRLHEKKIDDLFNNSQKGEDIKRMGRPSKVKLEMLLEVLNDYRMKKNI